MDWRGTSTPIGERIEGEVKTSVQGMGQAVDAINRSSEEISRIIKLIEEIAWIETSVANAARASSDSMP